MVEILFVYFYLGKTIKGRESSGYFQVAKLPILLQPPFQGAFPFKILNPYKETGHLHRCAKLLPNSSAASFKTLDKSLMVLNFCNSSSILICSHLLWNNLIPLPLSPLTPWHIYRCFWHPCSIFLPEYQGQKCNCLRNISIASQ